VQRKKRFILGLIKALFLISELNPMPTEEICVHFNELRSDMVLLYELKTALATCEYELQTLRHQYEALNPGKVSGTNT
jgi:DNA methyltransferase 1-associated protein 1